MVPTSVQASSAKPTDPMTPPLTLLAKSITREVSSCAPTGPRALKSWYTATRRSLRARKIFRMAKLKAASGMSDSRVV
jgi:hypothetical protein